jgi:hypothetical protein
MGCFGGRFAQYQLEQMHIHSTVSAMALDHI